MKKTLVLMTIILFVGVEVHAREPENVRYDKFKDITTVESRPCRWALGRLGILGGGALSFQYHCPGQTSDCRPPGIGVTFKRYGKEWLLMHDERSIIFLVDGRRIAAQDVRWDGIVTHDGVVEFFVGMLSRDEFHGILAGKGVEIQVGSFTRRFSAKDLEDWRAFGMSVSKIE
jgi:hypothetical protein